MKSKLILFICMIVLPSIAHTQKQWISYANTNKLDSLSKERRLVLLAVNKMEYLAIDNDKLLMLNHSLNEINEHNAVHIAQLEGINKGLNEVLNKELNRKKKWRNATLYSLGFNAAFLTALIVLSK